MITGLTCSWNQLRGLDGAPGAEAAWAGSWPPAGPGAHCDATIVPVVTGHLDRAVLDQLTAALLRRRLNGNSCRAAALSRSSYSLLCRAGIGAAAQTLEG
jgi:hypothetical protein